MSWKPCLRHQNCVKRRKHIGRCKIVNIGTNKPLNTYSLSKVPSTKTKSPGEGIEELPQRQKDGMLLFGIRVKFQCANMFSQPPRKKQYPEHLLRLTGMKEEDVKTAKFYLQDWIIQQLNTYSNVRIPPRFQNLNKNDALNSMTIHELYARMRLAHSFSQRTGTIVGYDPLSEMHEVLFDDSLSKKRSVDSFEHDDYHFPLFKESNTNRMNLCKRNDWERIPWDDHIINADGTEQPTDSFFMPSGIASYGPSCPRCQHNLGTGIQAWAYCKMCSLNEPGIQWSMRFAKNDPNAWSGVSNRVFEKDDDE